VVALPEYVHHIKAKGRDYFYWHPHRGTDRAGKPVRLPDDPRSEEFQAAVRKLAGKDKGEGRGTFRHVIDLYLGSPKFAKLRPATQRDYRFHLERIKAMWGDVRMRDIRPKHVQEYMETLAKTPVLANHAVAVLGALYKWAIPREFAHTNPCREVERFESEGGHEPWPAWAIEIVAKHAPEDIRRAVQLCLHTGQRISDVCRMRPADREGRGIVVRIGKLRDKRHWVPLVQAAIAEIDGWPVEPMDLYFKSPVGTPYNANSFGARWQRWLRTEAAAPIRKAGLTVHGLRASAVVLRRREGLSDQEISNQIGMSVPMVSRYSRFADQKDLAEASIERLDERLEKRQRRIGS
jgi:integrase